jgi:hypothetical protein
MHKAVSGGGGADSGSDPEYHRLTRRTPVTLPRSNFIIPLTLVMAVVLVCLAADQPAKPQMSVTLKQSPVRDKPSFTGKVIAALVYADRVTIEETKGDWFRISFPPKKIVSGWIHKGALVQQEIVLKAGEKAVGTTASSGEVALAGKGFSEEIEKEYRQANPALGYAAVDRMENYQVASEKISDFIAQGGLAVEGGAP